MEAKTPKTKDQREAAKCWLAMTAWAQATSDYIADLIGSHAWMEVMEEREAYAMTAIITDDHTDDEADAFGEYWERQLESEQLRVMYDVAHS